jgi:hypothetical protein
VLPPEAAAEDIESARINDISQQPHMRPVSPAARSARPAVPGWHRAGLAKSAGRIGEAASPDQHHRRVPTCWRWNATIEFRPAPAKPPRLCGSSPKSTNRWPAVTALRRRTKLRTTDFRHPEGRGRSHVTTGRIGGNHRRSQRGRDRDRRRRAGTGCSDLRSRSTQFAAQAPETSP